MTLVWLLQTLQSVYDRWSLCRADNIIRDAEVVRKAMCHDCGGTGLWTLLGQSFGGFCAVRSLQRILLISSLSAALRPLPGPETSSHHAEYVSATQAKLVCINRDSQVSHLGMPSCGKQVCRRCLTHGRLTGALPECVPCQPG